MTDDCRNTPKWHPVYDTLRMAIIILIIGSQVAILIKDGGWEWLVAISIVLIVGMAS